MLDLNADAMIELERYRRELEKQDEYDRSPLFAPCDPDD